jgi:hypothetical protein
MADEDAPVDFGDIERIGHRAGERVERCDEPGRDGQLLREMIERAERQDAERATGAGENRRGGVYRPIPAADEHEIDGPVEDPADRSPDRLALGNGGLSLDAVGAEDTIDESGGLGAAEPRQRAGARV